jgi:hypothetical protein
MSNSIDIDERSMKYYEVRERILNNSLKDFGINVEVSLDDHWPYQLLRYKLGYEKDLIYLSQLALQNPWVSNLPSKLKTVFMLWLEAIGMGSSRL